MLSPLSPFYCAHCIICRLPESSCICSRIKRTELPFKITLFCHSKEWQRNDNTGQWAILSSQDITRYRWHRKPDRIRPVFNSKQALSDGGHFLLFPSEDSQSITDIQTEISNLWVIDGTWQEAQKMLNQSPYLQSLPKVSIASATSQFLLRRNQKGLSTIEAIEWAIRNSNPTCNSADILKFNFELAQNQLLQLLR